MSKGPEHPVEMRLKWLEEFGFEVLKFTTPGFTGVMDRLILHPTWAPAPPILVECKAPGKVERLKQATLRDNWRKRGVDVRDMVDTEDRAIALCDRLLTNAVDRYMALRLVATGYDPLPAHVKNAYNLACDRLNQPRLGVI